MKVSHMFIILVLPAFINSYFFGRPAERRFMFSRMPSFLSSFLPKTNRFKWFRPFQNNHHQTSYVHPRPPVIKYKRPRDNNIISYKPLYPSPYHQPKYPLVTYSKSKPILPHKHIRNFGPSPPHPKPYTGKPTFVQSHKPVPNFNKPPPPPPPTIYHRPSQQNPSHQGPNALIVHHMVPTPVKRPHIQHIKYSGFGEIREEPRTRHLSGFEKPRPYSIIENPKPKQTPPPEKPSSMEMEIPQNTIEQNTIKGMLPPPPLMEMPKPVEHSVMISMSPENQSPPVKSMAEHMSSGADMKPKTPLFVYQSPQEMTSQKEEPPATHTPANKYKAGSLVIDSVPSINAGILPLENEKPKTMHRFPPYV